MNFFLGAICIAIVYYNLPIRCSLSTVPSVPSCCRYITVGHEQQKRHLYYYFAISERNPSLDPVVIWINGGPACSGFSAFLHSFGKYVLSSDGICSVVSGIVILVTEKGYALLFLSMYNRSFLQDLLKWRAPKFISMTVHE